MVSCEKRRLGEREGVKFPKASNVKFLLQGLKTPPFAGVCVTIVPLSEPTTIKIELVGVMAKV